MNKVSCAVVAIITMFATVGLSQRGATPPEPQDSGPATAKVKEFIDAYNRQDNDYYQKIMASDIVLMDDDGHTLFGRDRVMQMMQTRARLIPQPQKLVPGAITSQGTADVEWAGFPYTFDVGEIHRKGLITLVFKKVGTDWQIAHFHFSIDQPNSLQRR